MRFLVLTFLYALSAFGAADAAGQETRWRQHAENVRIVRDNWGIAHIYGKSDADAVFGTIYAQAEDDFARIEHNYLNALGCWRRPKARRRFTAIFVRDCSSIRVDCVKAIAAARLGSKHSWKLGPTA